MKIETKEIYKCEHCNKLYQIEGFCKGHEIICHKNPGNSRACFSCSHLTKKETTVYFDDPRGGEIEQRVSLLHCPKIDSFLYPPKVEHKMNWYEFDENQPMPKICDKHSDIETDIMLKNLRP